MSWKWKGVEYLPGIPTDDLSDEYVDGLSSEVQAVIRRIYDKVKDKPVKVVEAPKTEVITAEEGAN